MTPIKLHWTLVIPFAMTVTSPSSLAVIAMCYLILIAHEYGHVLAGKVYGRHCEEIWLSAIGGMAVFPEEPETPYEEEFCALAGPAVNVALLVVGAWVMETYGLRENLMMQAFIIINGFMAAFNLIPAFPMDGGRVFRSILWHFMEKRTATRISLVLTGIIGTGLLFLGPIMATIGVFLFVMIYFNWE